MSEKAKLFQNDSTAIIFCLAETFIFLTALSTFERLGSNTGVAVVVVVQPLRNAWRQLLPGRVDGHADHGLDAELREPLGIPARGGLDLAAGLVQVEEPAPLPHELFVAAGVGAHLQHAPRQRLDVDDLEPTK